MCPACLAAMAPAIAGAASGTGVLALVVKKLRGRRRKGEQAMEQIVSGSPKVVSRDEWLEARRALLLREKELTRAGDELARQRRELPWERVEKEYVFDAPGGKRSLAELFAGKSQLVVYHFMFGPDWPQGCPSCSLLADHFDGMNQHLPHRDVRLLAVSRAPLPKIEAFKQRMGWRFDWVSSFDSDFNQDLGVAFSKEEVATGEIRYNYGTAPAFGSEDQPGLSVFRRAGAGDVFHTYSAYARGLDHLLGVYGILDLTPRGRDEDAFRWPMEWVRHHDRYDG